MRMLKLAALSAMVLGATCASATTWRVSQPNGRVVVFGNVCRQWANGVFGPLFTVYPVANGQPVGSPCPVRDNLGRIIAQGRVSNE